MSKTNSLRERRKSAELGEASDRSLTGFHKVTRSKSNEFKEVPECEPPKSRQRIKRKNNKIVYGSDDDSDTESEESITNIMNAAAAAAATAAAAAATTATISSIGSLPTRNSYHNIHERAYWDNFNDDDGDDELGNSSEDDILEVRNNVNFDLEIRRVPGCRGLLEFERCPDANLNYHGRLITTQFKSEQITDKPLSSGTEDEWTWDILNKSCGVVVNLLDRRMALFHPEWSVGTAGVRGTKLLNNSKSYWEIELKYRILGSSTMFGIGTKKSRLGLGDYADLIGEDEQSWGLTHKGYLYHDGGYKSYTKSFNDDCHTVVGLLFDGMAGTLSYYKNGEYLGIAFTGLDKVKEELYPMACTTAGRMKMILRNLRTEVMKLKELTRNVITKHVYEKDVIEKLPLPPSLQTYVWEGVVQNKTYEDPNMGRASVFYLGN